MIKIFQRLIDLDPEPVSLDPQAVKEFGINRRFFLIGTAAALAATQVPTVLEPKIAQARLVIPGGRNIKGIYVSSRLIHKPIYVRIHLSQCEELKPRLLLSCSSGGLAGWVALTTNDALQVAEDESVLFRFNAPQEGIQITIDSLIQGRAYNELATYEGGKFNVTPPIPLSLR